MRFSAITALCATPLALAGTLQANSALRGATLEAGMVARDNVPRAKDKDSTLLKASEYSDHILTESTAVDEVIIIWVNQGGGAATSTVTDTITVTAPGTNTAAAAATHSVTVGGIVNGVPQLTYTPNTIEAAVGDMVIFTFDANNHTLTQAAFTTPCEALPGGKDSGFMPNMNNTVSPAPQMMMQVTVATPIWFYCRQKGHCGKGMTFSINPTATKTQAMFEQMAIAQNGTAAAPPAAAPPAVAPPAAAPPNTGSSTTASVVAPPAATSASSAPAAGSTGLSQGSGSINSQGTCDCSCLCGTAAFPNAAVQGIGAYGGMPGSMPMAALAA